MTETYDEIIESTKSNSSPLDYCIEYGLKLEKGVKYFETAARHLCERVRKAVAGDLTEWYVLDMNGKDVHIGDYVTNGFACNHEVIGLCIRNRQKTVEYDDGFDFADTVRLIPDSDTQEKIIEDLARDLSTSETDKFDDMVLANKYFKRIVAFMGAEK